MNKYVLENEKLKKVKFHSFFILAPNFAIHEQIFQKVFNCIHIEIIYHLFTQVYLINPIKYGFNCIAFTRIPN